MVRSLGYKRDGNCISHYKSNCFSVCPANNWFFRRPKLRIEHETDYEQETFSPAHTFIGLNKFTQKFLRIRVRNTGRSMAHRCTGFIRIIIPPNVNTKLYPSRDSKQLGWGRSPDKSDLSNEVNIYPIIGEAICHVIFSDSSFKYIQVSDVPTRYASISILDRLRTNELRVEDSFSIGSFVIVIVICSEETYCKAKFKVEIQDHHNAIFMRKFTRYESFKLRVFKSFP